MIPWPRRVISSGDLVDGGVELAFEAGEFVGEFDHCEVFLEVGEAVVDAFGGFDDDVGDGLQDAGGLRRGQASCAVVEHLFFFR